MWNAWPARPIRIEEVETDLGPLLLHSDDETITPIIRAHGTWEPELGEELKVLLKPGMTAVDVGGNVGYTALLMSEAVGPDGLVSRSSRTRATPTSCDSTLNARAVLLSR